MMIRNLLLFALCICSPLSMVTARHAPDWRPLPLNVTLDLAVEKLGRDALGPIHTQAETLVYDINRPIIVQSYNLQEVENTRPGIDPRVYALRGRETREQLALALDDMAKAALIREELNTLATSYRYSGRKDVLQRIIDQVEEVCSWPTVQRPGWLLLDDPDAVLPQNAGAWRANAHLMFSFADLLKIMPPESLPAKTEAMIHQFLLRQVAGIMNDFANSRQPFFEAKDAKSLDWVLLHAATIRANEALPERPFAQQQEIALLCLMRSLSIIGEDGSWPTGFMDGFLAIEAMLDAGRAMAIRGYKQILEAEYFSLFIDWSSQFYQPAGLSINWGDARRLSPFPKDNTQIRRTWAKVALMRNSPRARFALERLTSGPTNDFTGLDYQANGTGSLEAPTTVRHFHASGLIAWRSGWTENNSALWINLSDDGKNSKQHDRGHINLIFDGKPVLIEAGSPPYMNPQAEVYFDATDGHNTLTLENEVAIPADVRELVAPLTEAYGEVTLQLADFYPSLRSWNRKIYWSPDRLRVEDVLRSEDDKAIAPVIRWHLGAKEPVKMRSFGQSRFILTWEGVEMEIQTSGFLDVRIVEAPDYTLQKDPTEAEPHIHQCVEIRPARPSKGMSVSTLIFKR